MAERGEIAHPERIKQVLAFSGFRYGTITPTDFDFAIEYHSKAWVVGEVKLRGTPLNAGQRQALKEFIDDVCRKKAIAFFAVHEVFNPAEAAEIRCSQIVEFYQRDTGWKLPNHPITAKEFVDRYISYIDRGREHI